MPNNSAGTHPRSVFIRVTRAHTDRHFYRVTPSLLPLSLLTSRINGSAIWHEQATQLARGVALSSRYAGEDDDIARWGLSLR